MAGTLPVYQDFLKWSVSLEKPKTFLPPHQFDSNNISEIYNEVPLN